MPLLLGYGKANQAKRGLKDPPVVVGDSNTNRTPSGRGDENESLLPNLKETKRKEKDYVTVLAQQVPRTLPLGKEHARS